MTGEIPLAMEIAKWIAIWHLGVALYLVWYAEHKTPFLMGIALLKAALGTLIYLIVLEPEWVLETEWPFIGTVDGVLLPLALILLGAVSIVLTWALWQLYEFGGPAESAIRIVRRWVARLWNSIRR